MQLFHRRTAAIVLLSALAAYFIVRGIVPAMSKIDTDFPNYFTAAKIVADGGDVGRLYDNAWFQEQMRHYHIGVPSEGKFGPFPPPTALLFLPFTSMQPLNALRAATAVSVISLICSIVLLARILARNWLDTALFVLLSGYAILGALRLGQPYILVSLSCILGYYARLKGRPLLAGMCFGLFAPVKYFPVVFLIYFACRKEWKVAIGGAIAILAVVSLSIGVLGLRLHVEFLSSILGNHLIGNLGMQSPFTSSFQSFDALFRRLFVFDPTLNPQPLLAMPALHSIGVIIVKASIFIAAVATLVKLARNDAASAAAPSIGILGIVTLLLAPANATYHFVLLWLPVGLLIDYFFRRNIPLGAYILLAAYSIIGFFPYRFVDAFEGSGGWTILAYPRLFLLLTMYVTAVYFIWNPAQATPAPAPATATAAR
jgi:Glycosyltransferase family 87